MITKIRNNRGDSIIEALVSLLIAVISVGLLVASISSATKVNEKSRAQVTDELSFTYVQKASTSTGNAKSPTPGEVTIDFGDTGEEDQLTATVNVNVYTTDNGYSYYEKRSKRSN